MTNKTKSRSRRGGESQEQHEQRMARLFRGAKTPLEIMEVSAQILRENDAAARRVIDTGKQERDALRAQIAGMQGHIKTLQDLAETIAAESDAKDEYVTDSQRRFAELLAINEEMQAFAARDAVMARDAFRLMATYGETLIEHAREGETEALIDLCAELQETSHKIADSYSLRIAGGIHTALMDHMDDDEPDQTEQETIPDA